MAMEFATLVIEALCGKILTAIGEVCTRFKQFKPLLKQLESTVERITPIFEDIASLNEDVSRPATETEFLRDQLKKGEKIVKECAGARWWNKSSYAKKLIEYDRLLTRFFQIDVPAQILHGVRQAEKKKKEKEEDKKKKEKAEDKKMEKKEDKKKKEKAEDKKMEKEEDKKEDKKKEEEFDGFVPPPPAPPPPAPRLPPAMSDDDEHTLDFLRNSPQFLALVPLLKEDPDILKLTLQGLREKNSKLLNDIKKRKVEFLQLIYGPVDDISKLIEDHKDVYEELIDGPVDGSDGHLSDEEMHPAFNVSRAEQEMPHTISVILAEQEAIERLEEMGFDSDLVIEAFLACDGNEELAVNYLLENAGYFED